MSKRTRTYLLFVLTALVLFFPGLGAVHLFDWDEINFAEISREMILLNDYSRVHVNFQPFWEKPPLFFWLQSACMHLFGVGEYAARLPNAVCGIVTLLVIVRIGERLHSLHFGALWALAYLGSILPHLYFRSGIIDPWFNLFIFLGIYHFIMVHWKKDPRTEQATTRSATVHALIGGGSLGLAMLTKGPASFLIFSLTVGVYWLLSLLPKFRGDGAKPGTLLLKWTGPLLVFCGTMVAVTLTWFGYETWKNGPWFVSEFITYQIRLFSTPDAGHAGFPGYHFVMLGVGCFPASLFAIQEMMRRTRDSRFRNDMRRWMLILFWVVVILFTLVQSKIVHYSSMCYLPLTYLATLTIERVWTGEAKLMRFTRIGLWCAGGIFALVTLVAPFIGQHIEVLHPLLSNDAFAQANLEANVVWTGLEAICGLWMLATLYLGLKWIPSRPGRGILTLFSGSALFVTIALFFFVNRVEGYSQAAAIRFLEARQGETCYVLNMYYRTYTVYFYTRKPPVTDPRAYDGQWLLYGDVDRPVYAICRITDAEKVRATATLQEIGSENGFVFFKRKSPSP